MHLAAGLSTSAAVHLLLIAAFYFWFMPDDRPRYDLAQGRSVTLVLSATRTPTPTATVTPAAPRSLQEAPAQSKPSAPVAAPEDPSRETLVARLASRQLPPLPEPPARMVPETPRLTLNAAAAARRQVSTEDAPSIPDDPPPALARRPAPTRPTAAPAQPPVEPLPVGVEIEEPPQALPTNTPPTYPPEARRSRAQGRTLLMVRITSDGSVAAVHVERSSGHASLDQAALSAVQKWRFTPARRAGRAREAVALIPIRFTLR